MEFNNEEIDTFANRLLIAMKKNTKKWKKFIKGIDNNFSLRYYNYELWIKFIKERRWYNVKNGLFFIKRDD